MSQPVDRIIYKPGTPDLFRKWSPKDMEDLGWMWWPTVVAPVAVTLLSLLVLCIVDFLFLPGGREWNLDHWMQKASVGLGFLAAGGEVTYHVWRRRYVMLRTDNNDMRTLENHYWSLPSDLRAEATPLRNQALHYLEDKNHKGVAKCREVMVEFADAATNRTEHRQTREVATDKEFGRSRQAVVTYREETLGLYRPEITASESETKSPSPPTEDEIVLDGEIVPDNWKPRKPRTEPF